MTFFASSIFSRTYLWHLPPPKKMWHHTKPCPPPALKGDFPNVEFHPRSPDLPPQSWWKLKSWYFDNNKTWVIWAQLKMEFINLSHPQTFFSWNMPVERAICGLSSNNLQVAKRKKQPKKWQRKKRTRPNQKMAQFLILCGSTARAGSIRHGNDICCPREEFGSQQNTCWALLPTSHAREQDQLV